MKLLPNKIASGYFFWILLASLLEGCIGPSCPDTNTSSLTFVGYSQEELDGMIITQVDFTKDNVLKNTILDPEVRLTYGKNYRDTVYYIFLNINVTANSVLSIQFANGQTTYLNKFNIYLEICFDSFLKKDDYFTTLDRYNVNGVEQYPESSLSALYVKKP